MPARLGRFEMPKSLTKDEASATETYAKFIADPFEAGYGQTVGNSLRRVLLSSLEGAAITSIRITGAHHEFATLTGIVEDVTDIVLNLKKIKFKAVDHEPRTVTINVNKEGQITAGDIQTIQGIEVLNTNQVICTVDKKRKFEAEFDVRIGRGLSWKSSFARWVYVADNISLLFATALRRQETQVRLKSLLSCRLLSKARPAAYRSAV